eukprot:scaffold271839_cov12-Tisochrysis_lutea.AAC.1
MADEGVPAKGLGSAWLTPGMSSQTCADPAGWKPLRLAPEGRGMSAQRGGGGRSRAAAADVLELSWNIKYNFCTLILTSNLIST